jgi:membrane AbrB-like protein
MYKQNLLIFLLAAASGFIFFLLHLPIPWTLGPMALAILWKAVGKKPLSWPKKVRNVGLVVLGYMLGSPFTPNVADQVVQQLPVMLTMTLLLIILCLGTGYLSGRYTGVGLTNSLMGSIPGGLSQMSAICEEIEGINLSAVTLMQTVRVLTVLSVVPMLALHGIAGGPAAAGSAVSPMTADQIPVLALFALIILILIKLAKHLRVSSVYVLAPVLGTAGLVLAGVKAPVLPAPVIAIAQICVGIRMGQDVDFGSLSNWKKIAVANFFSVLSVILLLLGIAYAYSHIYPASFVTAFISMAPGGISEMGLTAMAVNADLPTVVAYQLFRLLFILLACVPATRWLIRKTCTNRT